MVGREALKDVISFSVASLAVLPLAVQSEDNCDQERQRNHSTHYGIAVGEGWGVGGQIDPGSNETAKAAADDEQYARGTGSNGWGSTVVDALFSHTQFRGLARMKRQKAL